MPDATDATTAARVAELEAQLVQMKQDLWVARDATIGATAELGTARAKVTELEALIHQLRLQLAAQDALLRSRSVQLATRATKPIRAVRRILR